jgi:Raf kinase inhibitor-like YbhB/YbcL family protein
MNFSITSEAFRDGATIPAEYTCDGRTISPPLQWSEPPSGTECFVLIVDDPDAPGGTFNHWILFNIPPSSRGIHKGALIEGGILEGRTSYGRKGWGGPCPPRGPAHHYHFKIFALDNRLALKAGASRQQIDGAIKGHILAEATLTGLYQRK